MGQAAGVALSRQAEVLFWSHPGGTIRSGRHVTDGALLGLPLG